MSIKAKAVEKDRAAAFAKGNFANASAAETKRSFYYESERHYEEREREASASSASSSPTTSRSSSPAAPTQRRPNASPPGERESDADMSEDEAVVRRARAATRALLGGGRPASAAPAVAAAVDAPPSTRLEAYLRGRAASVPSAVAPPSLSTAAGRTPEAVAQSQGRDGGWTGTREAQASHNLLASSALASGAPNAASSAATPAGEVGSSAAGFAAVTKALEPHTANAEFAQLLSLLEADVRREQHERAVGSLAAADPPASAAGAVMAEGAARPRTPPPSSFAALQNNALEQLFEDWCQQGGADAADDLEAADGAAHVFVAADHHAAAFTLAATTARALDASSWGGGASAGAAAAPRPAAAAVSNAPLTWEELSHDAVARRNARGSDTVPGTAAALAAQATQQLRRFLQSVECIERLVGNRKFMRTVAAFLYEHHKVFLPHYEATRSPPPAPSLADPASPAAAPSTVVEHRHEEYAVYREFGQRVSDALLTTLSSSVDGFDEAEFVEALYDTPAVFPDSDGYGSSGEGGGGGGAKGPQNVLSFPAWRLVLAMSDFESFFAWVMDYIYEEYHLDGLEGDDGAAVAVAGARGLRALIRSTYKRPTAAPAPSVDEAGGAAPSHALPSAAAAPAVKEGGPAAESPGDASKPLSSHALSESPLRPRGPLAPLASSAPPHPAPIPTALSSSLSASSGAPLRQFFPSPPASAEGSTRAAIGKAAPTYRKRQTTNPARNLPPITPSADAIVRPGSADGHESAGVGRAPAVELSASVPAPQHVSDAAPTKKATAAAAAGATKATRQPSSTSARLSVSTPRQRRRSSQNSAAGESVAAGSSGSRRGSQSTTAGVRTASSTRGPAKGAAAAAKPRKPKLPR